ncbi:hypothetical protein [Christiangramia sp. SM2212]|uniref:Thioredoxin domain-containing protein n=1 Tax=Christiangramia sediminicola TaxID=3073267 RepID=A0ABU1EQX2_9FLAO|nr:hypothetical protein [Christiangramia sp. SM2212]MDR5590791.1 hypothetical protein [Christiangramia sp. SM2212]
MKYFFYLSLCCVLLVTGCEDNSRDSDTIYIGGQINNPETDYVVISRENETIDTLYLDEKNQFGKDYENLEGGIYTFKHPPESQILYTEPGDSILIWLNTMSFDESLNFSGEGADKSNFLLDMFLKNQNNNDLILTYYKIEPSEFAKMTDSIKEDRLKTLDRLQEKSEFSDEFLEIAMASINYEYYDLRERYTFLIRKYYNSFAEKIPEDFNKYREEIDFNNEELQDYYVYTNLIDDYLRSKSIEACTEKHKDHKKCFDLNSFKNIERRVILIDSLSEIESLKNEFLDRLAAQAITMSENQNRLDSVMNLLGRIDYSNLQSAKNLAEIQRSYFIGNSIADFVYNNTNGEITTFKDFQEKPVVTFVWSIYAPAHHRWQHSIIQGLRTKYPEVEFIGLNIDQNEKEEWLRTIETFGYNKDKEYQLSKRTVSKKIYRKYLNKILFIDSSGNIVRGDIQLGSPDFENDLLEFINN